MLIPDKTKAIIRSALASYPVDEASIELYTTVDLLPRDFGYTNANWTSWKDEHSGAVKNGVTLTSADVVALRAALANVAKIVATTAGYMTRSLSGYATKPYIPRLTNAEIAILAKAGLRPIDLGVGQKTWAEY